MFMENTQSEQNIFIPGEDASSWRPQERAISGDGTQRVNLGADANLMVHFEEITEISKEVRDATGRPKLYKKLLVRVKKPGDPSYLARPATESDKIRFRDAWLAYTTGSKQTGTSLDDWDFANTYQKNLLRALGIFTVEQVAALTEMDRQKVGIDANDLWQAANIYLEKKQREGNDSAHKQMFTALQARSEGLEAKLLAQMERTAELEKLVADATSYKEEKTKTRTRKSKEEIAALESKHITEE